MDSQQDWDDIYTRKDLSELSWQQPAAELSLALIREFAPALSDPVIDVGGGASPLVGGLLDSGYRDVTILDLAPAALGRAQARLGVERSARVQWIAADVCKAPLPDAHYAVWHDRAVFHFLTEEADRRAYIEQVRRATQPGGVVLVATFAEDGPTRCSGLPVARYSAAGLHGAFGDDFILLRARREVHQTPWGALQPFTYCVCRYVPSAARRDAA